MGYAFQRVEIGELGTVVDVEAEFELVDYGVVGSPKHLERGDLRFAGHTVELYGVQVSLKDMGAELRNALLELAEEYVCEDNWERY